VLVKGPAFRVRVFLAYKGHTVFYVTSTGGIRPSLSPGREIGCIRGSRIAKLVRNLVSLPGETVQNSPKLTSAPRDALALISLETAKTASVGFL